VADRPRRDLVDSGKREGGKNPRGSAAVFILTGKRGRVTDLTSEQKGKKRVPALYSPSRKRKGGGGSLRGHAGRQEERGGGANRPLHLFGGKESQLAPTWTAVRAEERGGKKTCGPCLPHVPPIRRVRKKGGEN